MRMRSRSALFVLLAAFLLACSDDTNSPTAGAMNLNLATPNSDDGGLLFTLAGGPVDSVVATSGRVYSAKVDPNTFRVIIAGNLAGGTIARIYLPDLRRAGEYSATVTQAAARGSYVQRDPAGYTLTLSE
jgi:hypothetical protein